MSDMRVTVDQITFDEYAEASAALRRHFMEKQKKEDRRSPAVIVMGVVFAVLITGAMGGLGHIDPLPEMRPAAASVVMFVVPLLGMFSFLLIAAAAQQTASSPSFAKRIILSAIPLIALVALLAAVLWWTSDVGARPTDPLPRAGPDWYGTLIPHAMWLLLTFLLAVLTVRATWRQVSLAWNASPSLKRIKQCDITSTGLHIDEGVWQRTYAWPAFVRFIETDNLLILCPSDITCEILPKRAFASPEDLHTAKALFQAQISIPGESPVAFPVIPAKPT